MLLRLSGSAGAMVFDLTEITEPAARERYAMEFDRTPSDISARQRFDMLPANLLARWATDCLIPNDSEILHKTWKALSARDNARFLSARPSRDLMPRRLFEDQRKQDILAACARYVQAGQRIPEEWVIELMDLNSRAEVPA